VDEIYYQAVKLLRRRDYSIAQLRERLVRRFGEIPDQTIQILLQKGFLDDTRFAGNLVIKRRNCHPSLIREELLRAGVAAEIVERTLSTGDWPSLQEVLRSKMNDWKIQAPLHRKEAARLFRALARHGFPEDEIREELEQLHEQQ
jgi:SOS response regulatory protein OraA/RecX